MVVSFYATLRPIVGAKRIELPVAEECSVIELMRKLAGRWPDLGEHLLSEDGHLSRRVNVLIGGRNVRWLDGEQTRLASDAHVDVFPPAAGG